MHIATQSDSDVMQAIVNDIFDEISADGDRPFNPQLFLDPPNWALMVNGGFFGAVAHGLGRIECHTNFVLGSRGLNAIVESRAALNYCFVKTNTYDIVTRVPGNNIAAAHLARLMGFRKLFSRENAWVKRGMVYPINYLCLDVDDWIMSGVHRSQGEWFHDEIHRQCPQAPHHGRDRVHDNYVGAAIEMIRAGNVEKAIIIYNRWARLAGYAQIQQLSEEPLTLRAGDQTITINGEHMEVTYANNVSSYAIFIRG